MQVILDLLKVSFTFLSFHSTQLFFSRQPNRDSRKTPQQIMAWPGKQKHQKLNSKKKQNQNKKNKSNQNIDVQL